MENLLQPRHARANFFRKLLNPGVDPSPGYDKLAEFLHLGPVRNILTTNFDALLPEVRILKRRPHFLDVIQTSADYTKFSTSPQHPQLVYLHGSVGHYTDKNLIEEVQRLDKEMVEMLVPLLRDHPLIVVGYRGGEPSVMRHLLMENAQAARDYRHGIFWCKMKGERSEELSPLVSDLARTIGSNFTLVDIDGFDELFAKDLWTLQQEAQSRPAPAGGLVPLASPALDLAPVAFSGLDQLDWATVRARIVQYCNALQIRVPEQPDRAWVTHQLFQSNLAAWDAENVPHLTTAGYLLFGSHPQKQIGSAKIVVRAQGSPEWLERAMGPKADRGRVGLILE